MEKIDNEKVTQAIKLLFNNRKQQVINVHLFEQT